MIQITMLNFLFAALSCTEGNHCSGLPGMQCVADYCQPPTCTTTGQCVYGQICSQNSRTRSCVCKYNIILYF